VRVSSIVKFASIMLLTLLSAGAAESQDSVLDAIKKRGTLVVGNATFVPWAMRSKSGELIGFEIDVAKKVAEDLGAKVDFQPTAWGGIIPALLAGKFDVIIGGMSITAERAKTVDFTIPYSTSGQAIVANKALAGGFKKLEDFDAPNVNITCRRGTLSCQTVQNRFPKAQMRAFEDDAQATQELLNGNAHAFISSAPRPRFIAIDNPDKAFMPTDEFLVLQQEGFALRQGDAKALEFFNAWIKTNTDNGWLKARHDFWFTNRTWAEQVASN
jgi:polar amino acid transport system substrate-binding protein